MAYISIENFKYGLDNRKSVLTSNPGALVKCENAHINEGGEVEKRKSFTQFVADATNDANGDHAFFGLEASSFGLLTFTHDTVVTVPAGLTKRILKHPEVYDGGSYNRAKHRITSIPCSQPYQGNVIVFATFADGNTFGYYCQSADSSSIATPIDHFRNGLFFTSSVIRTDIKRIINNISGWVAADADTDESAFDRIVSVKSPISITFSAVPSVVSTNGKMGFSFLASSLSSGTQLVRAYAGFQITAAANATTITVSGTVNGVGGINIGKFALSGVDTTNAAIGIVNSINKLTGLTGYSAAYTTANVWVFAPTNTDPGQITITSTGGTTIGAVAGTQSYFITPSTSAISKTVNNSSSGLVLCSSGILTIYAQGGTAPYKYQWTETGEPSGITISYPTSYATGFQKSLYPHTSVSGSFRCTVTDNNGAGTALYLDISITFIRP